MHEVIGACPLDCPDACSWVATVQDGVTVRLRGNPDHPFTRGGLCTKMNPYPEYAASPARLRTPLRRSGPKGAGEFVPVSWDEALAEIADRFRGAIDEDGAESIWPFVGTGSLGWLQGCGAGGVRLFHALGASRHRVDICSVAGHAGMAYTTGSAMGLDPEDLAHSALVVLWGTNTLTTNLHLWPFVTAARERGAELVVVDPVRTRTARQADRHLAPRPGTDAALVLGLMAELVRLGATDEEYLTRWSVGWPEFRDTELSAWSAARAADVCGLPVDDVEWLAGRIAACRPTGIRSLMGMQRHRGGGAALRALSCLPAVTGDYARRGGGLCYSTGRAYGLDQAAVSRPDLQPGGPTRLLDQSGLGRELLERTDPPVRVLYVWGANPLVSNPDTRRTREGLLRDGLFTVVVDHVLTDTARFADLLLPATTQLEHPDLLTSYSHVYLLWNEPAVVPPGECLSHTEIMRRLARELGLTEPALQATDHELAAAALGDSPSLRGITLPDLRTRGWARLAVPDPYLPFVEGFPTPSGRFEFRSERGATDGAGAFPSFVAPYEVGRGPARPDGTLELITAAQHQLMNSTFAQGPRSAAAGEQTVLLHPDDAAARQVSDGALVVLSNDRGAFTARARISDAVRPGVAATPKGFWAPSPTQDGVNAVTADRPSDVGEGATFHDTRVMVTPAS